MNKIKQNIGLIGTGNMGGAIFEALLRKKLVAPKNVWAYDKISEKCGEFVSRLKVRAASSAGELVSNVDVVLLAIKPQDLSTLAQEVRDGLKASHTVISILAGTRIERIREALGKHIKVVRAMPNLGAKVGEAMTAITGEELSLAECIFSACGKTVRLGEEHFDLVTALSGSGPAYFFLLMELLSRAGQEHGLSQDVADLLAVQTAVGASLVAQSGGIAPAELRRMVTSKGGTTEAALKVLESSNFAETFSSALRAALERGRELSKR